MEAYCIESVVQNVTPVTVDEAPDVSKIKPTISADVLKIGGKSRLVFYCDFQLPDTNFETYIYDVEWSLHSGASKLTSILLVDNVGFDDEQQFRDDTKLTENDLEKNQVFKPGFTLVCSVAARKSMLGNLSSSQDSSPKFCGIRLTPPLVRQVKQDKEIDIEFELTIPFGCKYAKNCTLELDMVVPEKNYNGCSLSDLAHTSIPKDGRHCGVEFDRVNQKKWFYVAATFGTNQGIPTTRAYKLVFSSLIVNNNHPFFGGYQLPPITIELSVDQTPLAGKTCHSVSDPHLKTFDDKYYDNHKPGTYIMYRHKELEAEVQTQTTPCYPGYRVHCNCGVSVRAGKDIFVINNCNDILQPPRIVYCNDGVLYRKITRTGSTYEITLPHGTKVKLIISWGHRNSMINVFIYPSLVDVEKSEGLCGMLDYNRDNDVPGSVDDFIDSWRVSPDEDLFDSTNYQHMGGWSEEAYFCSCSHGNLSFEPDTSCSSERKCRNEPQSATYPSQAMCDLFVRRKRRDSGGVIFDAYTDPTTAFYSTKQIKDSSDVEEHGVIRKRQTQYTNATARTDCLRLMNTSIFQICNKFTAIDVEGMINNCVLDATLTNSMDWTVSHLESIKLMCLEYVKVTQPLPQEVRAQLVVLPDANSTEDNNGTREYPTLPPPTNPPLGTEIITPELLSEIKAESCPNECSDHGHCENGTCKCDAPFGSFDCSLNVTQPPIMMGIPDKGQCDLQQRRCAETAVFGQNFAETDALSCRLQHFVVDTNNTIQHGATSDVRGHFESMFEVYCPLPESRSKRSVPNDLMANDALAYGYQASVSNDGNTFSEGDTIVIYDSQCVECSKITSKNKIICSRKVGYCVRSGRCYAPGETSDCYTCADDGGNDVAWYSGPNCTVSSTKTTSSTMGTNAGTPPDNTSTVRTDDGTPPDTVQVWQIGVIAGSCVLFVGLLIVLGRYICKRKGTEKKIDGSLSSIGRH